MTATVQAVLALAGIHKTPASIALPLIIHGIVMDRTTMVEELPAPIMASPYEIELSHGSHTTSRGK